MARRWQLSLWVLVGLVLVVVALWDNATVSAVADRVVERTEAVGSSDRRHTVVPGPSELAFGDLDGTAGPGLGDGVDANLLRPTTTTTTSRPTTTRPTVAEPVDRDEDRDPGSATTGPVGSDGSGGNGSFNPTPGSGTATTNPNRSSTSAAGAEAELTTVYYEDFASGSVDDGPWEIYHAAGHNGWGLRRRSAVTAASDPAAAGGYVLQITARMGSGDEAGQLVSGGMKLLGHSLSQGRYTVRARVDADPDEATSGVVQLWPSDDVWPDGGEINIMETWANRATRSPAESALHWAENGEHMFVGRTHSTVAGAVSAAGWHVYTLDWEPDRVAVSVDGSDPLVLSTDPSRIPRGPMDLTVQLDAFDTPSATGEQPTLSGEVRLMVDWIRVERFGSES